MNETGNGKQKGGGPRRVLAIILIVVLGAISVVLYRGLDRRMTEESREKGAGEEGSFQPYVGSELTEVAVEAGKAAVEEKQETVDTVEEEKKGEIAVVKEMKENEREPELVAKEGGPGELDVSKALLNRTGELRGEVGRVDLPVETMRMIPQNLNRVVLDSRQIAPLEVVKREELHAGFGLEAQARIRLEHDEMQGVRQNDGMIREVFSVGQESK